MADVLCYGSFPENKTHLINTRRIILDIEYCTKFTGKVNKTEPRLSFQEHFPKPQNKTMPAIEHLLLTESRNYWLLNGLHLSQSSPKWGPDNGTSATIAVGKENMPSSVLTGTEQPPKHYIPLFLLNIKFPTELQVQENLCNVVFNHPTFERNWNGCWVSLSTEPATVQIFYTIAKYMKASRNKNYVVLAEI